MTAPADVVWAVETRPGWFKTRFGADSETPYHFWLTEGDARRFVAGHKYRTGTEPRVVRFRLVRADEQPAEPPRDDVGELRECVVALLVAIRDRRRVATLGTDPLESIAKQLLNRLAAPGQGGTT